MRRKHLAVLLLEVAMWLGLNLAWPSRGSMNFEEQHFTAEFGASYGWPFKFMAPANDGGLHLIKASVTRHATPYPNFLASKSEFPYLVVEWPTAGFNVFVLVLVLGVTAGLFEWRRRVRRSGSGGGR